MSHDESIYPDPVSFSRDRFVEDGGINFEVQGPEKFVFGHRRRYISKYLATYRRRAPRDICVSRDLYRAYLGKHFAIRMHFAAGQ